MTTAATFIARLRCKLLEMPFNGHVVDYLGWYDDQGLITEESPLDRRYGIRSNQHCEVYGFKII